MGSANRERVRDKCVGGGGDTREVAVPPLQNIYTSYSGHGRQSPPLIEITAAEKRELERDPALGVSHAYS
jgi:hypothetical protein